MPRSPTDVVQLVGALGCGVCGCWNKTHASNWGGIRGFRGVFGAVVVVALLFRVQGAGNWSCVVPSCINYTWHVVGVACDGIMCVCSAVVCGVCLCCVLALLLLRRAVVVVRLGGAYSNGNTHMPHSPTKVVQ